MNIGIITSSIYNDYTAGLIKKLSAQSDKPVCIILAKKSPIEVLLRHYRTRGLIGLLRMFWRTINLVPKEERSLPNKKQNPQKASLVDLCAQEGIEIRRAIINSDQAVKYVKNKKLDILINAGGGIFKKPIIEAPNIGLLNAHMAYLPDFRGMNVLEWSLFYSHKIGVTLHFIERGIDMGDVFLFKEMTLNNGDTIASLRSKSIDINIDLMANGVKLLEEKNVEREKQLKEGGKQYFVMHHRLKSIIIKKLENNFGT